jgi:hypothetical protein
MWISAPRGCNKRVFHFFIRVNGGIIRCKKCKINLDPREYPRMTEKTECNTDARLDSCLRRNDRKCKCGNDIIIIKFLKWHERNKKNKRILRLDSGLNPE